MVKHIKYTLDFFLNKQLAAQRERVVVVGILNKFLDNEHIKYLTKIKIHKTKLYLFYNNSFWQYEVFLHQQQLLNEIKKYFPDIKNIKINISNG